MKIKEDYEKLRNFAVTVMFAPFKNNLKRKGHEYAMYKTIIDTITDGNFDIVPNLLFNTKLFDNITSKISDSITDNLKGNNKDTKKSK